jgi:hypothetical protein
MFLHTGENGRQLYNTTRASDSALLFIDRGLSIIRSVPSPSRIIIHAVKVVPDDHDYRKYMVVILFCMCV